MPEIVFGNCKRLKVGQQQCGGGISLQFHFQFVREFQLAAPSTILISAGVSAA
jgi:hypothetical protein